jgi:hypothetical protein
MMTTRVLPVARWHGRSTSRRSARPEHLEHIHTDTHQQTLYGLQSLGLPMAIHTRTIPYARWTPGL